MRISLIWAMSRNRVIGRDNDLPWHLARDMKHFMTTTRGHPVIMGRRQFESMPRALPHRTNIVMSRNTQYAAPGATVVGSLEAALDEARRQGRRDGVDEIFVIGGADAYRLALPLAHRLYVTEVDAVVQGDVYFPDFSWSDWRQVSRESFPADAANDYPFTVSVFDRT